MNALSLMTWGIPAAFIRRVRAAMPWAALPTGRPTRHDALQAAYCEGYFYGNYLLWTAGDTDEERLMAETSQNIAQNLESWLREVGPLDVSERHAAVRRGMADAEALGRLHGAPQSPPRCCLTWGDRATVWYDGRNPGI